MARVLFKHYKTMKQANKGLKILKEKGLNPAYTDAKYISGKKTGYDTYAVARKQKIKGFKSKKMPMSYI